MKGISCQNPFANLIAQGYKTIETRLANSSAAKTLHRGKLYICTSQKLHPQWDSIKKTFEPDGFGYCKLDIWLALACQKIWEKEEKNFGDPLNQWLSFREKLINPQYNLSFQMRESNAEKQSYIIAEVNLFAIRDMKLDHQKDACCEIYPTAKALMMDNIKPIYPIELKGRTNGFHLGIFDIKIRPEEIIYMI